MCMDIGVGFVGYPRGSKWADIGLHPNPLSTLEVAKIVAGQQNLPLSLAKTEVKSGVAGCFGCLRIRLVDDLNAQRWSTERSISSETAVLSLRRRR